MMKRTVPGIGLSTALTAHLGPAPVNTLAT
jgi:hypothetical protein